MPGEHRTEQSGDSEAMFATLAEALAEAEGVLVEFTREMFAEPQQFSKKLGEVE